MPERSWPVSTPLATTPAAVAWKLVIFAVNESPDDGLEFALAGGATAAAKASVENGNDELAHRLLP